MSDMEIEVILSTIFSLEMQNFKMLLTLKELLKKKGIFQNEEYIKIFQEISDAPTVTETEAVINMLTVDSVNKENPA